MREQTINYWPSGRGNPRTKAVNPWAGRPPGDPAYEQGAAGSRSDPAPARNESPHGAERRRPDPEA